MSPSNRGASASSSIARFGTLRRMPDGRHQGDPVHRAPGRRLRDVDQGRSEVDVRDLAVDRLPGGDAGAAEDERDPDRLLVRQELVPGDPVLALKPAVVGGEDDQRVVELMRVPEGLDQLGDVVVNGAQRAGATLVVELQLADLLLAHRRRVVLDVRGLVADVGLVEARRARQDFVLGLLLVARRRARVAARPTHQGGRDVLAVRRGGGPPEEERLACVSLARGRAAG